MRQWPGRIFSGDIQEKNGSLGEVADSLTETEVQWHFTQQGSSTAFSTTQSTVRTDASPYKEHFAQGATIVPRACYFIALNQDVPKDFADRILQVQTSLEIERKPPWDDIHIRGSIESRFLFITALANSILPFALHRPSLVVLPATVEQIGRGRKDVRLHSAKEIFEMGYRHAATWFDETERLWVQKRTERNTRYSSIDYLNWRQKLTSQDLTAPYLVIYNSSAKDANSVAVSREDFDLEFVAESKEYVMFTHSAEEALYVAAVLNSNAIIEQIRDFQTRGLFGFRDIHTKILDVWFPRFDSEDERHSIVAGLSRTAHEKAALFLKTNPPEHELTPRHLGALRVAIKEHLADELAAIDEIVLDIIT